MLTTPRISVEQLLKKKGIIKFTPAQQQILAKFTSQAQVDAFTHLTEPATQKKHALKTEDALVKAAEFTDENSVRVLKVLLTKSVLTLDQITHRITTFVDNDNDQLTKVKIDALEKLLTCKMPLSLEDAITQASNFNNSYQIKVLDICLTSSNGYATELVKNGRLKKVYDFTEETQAQAFEFITNSNPKDKKIASSNYEFECSLDIHNDAQLKTLEKLLSLCNADDYSKKKEFAQLATKFQTMQQFHAWEFFGFGINDIDRALDIDTQPKLDALTARFEIDSENAANFTESWHLLTIADLIKNATQQVTKFDCPEQATIWLKDGLDAALQYNCTGEIEIDPNGEQQA